MAARPGPILPPSVPSRIGLGRAETDFSATSDLWVVLSRDFTAKVGLPLAKSLETILASRWE